MSGEGRRKLSCMITEVSGLKIDFVVGLFDLPVNCKKPFCESWLEYMTREVYFCESSKQKLIHEI